MKRLTKRINGNEYALCGNVIYAKCENCQNRLPKCYEDDCHTEIEVLQKLATYEDSNLSPEEVMEMKSLCEKTYDDLRYRLRKYEQAVAEGRLIVLPCKIGEKVYRYCNDAINEGTIINILLNVKTGEIGLEYEMPTCYTCSRSGTLGKNLFLTREEAEKALGGGE